MAQNQTTSSDRKLVWEDNFDGDSLDYSKWGIEVNAFGGGNGELQIFTDRKENVRVGGGNLILEARRDNANIMYWSKRAEVCVVLCGGCITL